MSCTVDVEYVVWLVTARCNLNCKHCYAKPYLRERELTREDKLILVRQLSESSIPHVCISGGEPLILGEDLVDLVRELRDHGVEVSIVTNGTILRESLVDKLISLDVYLYISIDGGKTGHENLRGEGTWERTLNFLKYVSSRTSYFGTVMALSRVNYWQVPDYLDTPIRFNPSSISFIPVMPYGRARDTEVYIRVSELREAIMLIDKRADEYGIKVTIWCLPCLRAYTTSSRVSASRCRGRKVIDISPGGRLLLCDVTGIEVCKWSPDKHIRDLINYYFSSPLVAETQKTPQECTSCLLVESCGGGCYARSYQIYERFDKKDPLCPL